ncbi:hypothetical protein GCM10025868_34560 [Angustibacter aerolatus]|uniref:ABC transmembrane type-1 domain-containing protein n=1 Tax=Angustibacter aerolatus TaxID=1162965 RepID=A0ABQ6JNE6_9ACTN|nr:extracellular solute-binding protein [Angustibacter aerolatus]GMA88206.1 hypothetical protein GCM10025868_34560 [Angustibacter aerolatus]
MKADDIGVVPVPVPSGGKPISSMVAGINLAVFDGSEHKDAALQFVKFMTSTPEQITLNKTYGSLPTVQDAYSDPAFQTDAVQTFKDILSSKAAPLPAVPQESQFETTVGTAIKNMLADAASGKQVTDAEISSQAQAAQQQPGATGARARHRPGTGRRPDPGPHPRAAVAAAAAAVRAAAARPAGRACSSTSCRCWPAWASTCRLTQFYLRNWRAAPTAGLDNYRYALSFDQAAGKALLHSFTITCAFTLVVLVTSWLLGMAAAVWTQRTFRGRGLVRTAFLVPYALPVFASVITWSFMLQRDNGLVNHVLVDQAHVTDDRPFWLIGSNSLRVALRRGGLAHLALRVPVPHRRHAVDPGRPVRGGGAGRRRRRQAGSGS